MRRWLGAVPVALALLAVPYTAVLVAAPVAGGVTSVTANDAGTLDETFGHLGRAETDFGAWDVATDVAITANRRILVVGESSGEERGLVALYQRDGHRAPRFSHDGKLRVPFRVTEVAVQSRDRFLVAGSGLECRAALRVAAYHFDGQRAPAWGTNGVVTLPPSANFCNGDIEDMLVLPDRSVLVLTSLTIWRLRPGGRIDDEFGTDGEALAPAFPDGGSLNSMVLQSNGKIVVGAATGEGLTELRVLRYRPNGEFDPHFSDDGVSNRAPAGGSAHASVGIQSSGKIMVGGGSKVARFTLEGSLDRSFGSDGSAPGFFFDEFGGDVLNALLVQPNDKIVFVGYTDGFARRNRPFHFGVARLLPGGSRDRSFSDDGIAMTRFSRPSRAGGVARHILGRIVAVGSTGFGFSADFALARYLA